MKAKKVTLYAIGKDTNIYENSDWYAEVVIQKKFGVCNSRLIAQIKCDELNKKHNKTSENEDENQDPFSVVQIKFNEIDI